jgi:uncharacterized UBP type Zn finger protein
MITNSIKNVHARQRVDQLLHDREIESAVCEHLEQIHDVEASASGCEDCLKIGDPWVNLRICLTCGHVGCCDSSKNKHATKHYHATAHPIIQSFNPGESWIYCYVDDSLVTE